MTGASSAAEAPPGSGLRPLLVGIGNPSRGDDALGCALVEALRCDSEFADGCDLVWVYQLQPELAPDLVGRPAVLFVDAMRSVPAAPRLRLDRLDSTALAGTAAPQWSSHALSPPALVQLVQRISPDGPWPAAWVLGIAGEGWALGAPLSAAARNGLAEALAEVRAWRRALAPDAGGPPVAVRGLGTT